MRAKALSFITIFLASLSLFVLLVLGKTYAQGPDNSDDPVPIDVERTIEPLRNADIPPVVVEDEISGVDVILVFDRSGSMDDDGYDPVINDYQPIGGAKLAAIRFVTLMNLASDQVGLVAFNGTSILEQHLTQNSSAISSEIQNLSAYGGTDIASAINSARLEILGSNHLPNNAPAIIVLSDGQNNDGPDPVIQAANQAKAAGIRIFTIGLGTTVDQQTLKDTASSADDYYLAPTVEQLEEIYDKIARGVRPDPQGILKLSIADAFHHDDVVALGVSVFNPKTTSTNYTLKVELKWGFGTIVETINEEILVAFGSTVHRRYDFGSLDPDIRSYRVVAELYDQDGILIEDENAHFTVGDELYQSERAADKLTDAAKGEINQIENMLADDLPVMSVLFTAETSDFLLSNIIPWIKSADLPITAEALNAAVGELINKFLANQFWEEAANAPSSTLSAKAREWLINPELSPILGRIDIRHGQFINDILDETFTWDHSWDTEIVLVEDLIKNRIEEARINPLPNISTHWGWPPVTIEQATYQEVNSFFDWFAAEDGGQKWLGGLSDVILAISLIIAGIALLLFVLEPTPSGEISLVALLIAIKEAGGLIAAISVAKNVAVALFIILFGAVYFFNGVKTVANSVDGLHDNGLSSILQNIRQYNIISAKQEPISNPIIESSEEGIEVHPQLDQDVLVYTSYGALIDWVSSDRSDDGLVLPSGAYDIITLNPSQLEGTKQTVNLDPANVQLEIFVPDPVHVSDLNFTAHITVTNKSSDSETGQITVLASTLSGHGLETWDMNIPESGSNQFEHDFTVDSDGSHILRVVVADEQLVLDEAYTAVIVGEAPAFVMDVDIAQTYEPVQPVQIPIELKNVGNQGGQLKFVIDIFNVSIMDTPIITHEELFELKPQDHEALTINLDSPEPGRYVANFYGNGQFYGSRKFIIAAEGTLYIIPEELGQTISSNSSNITYNVMVIDNQLTAVDATLELVVNPPEGSELNLTATQTSTGGYRFEIPAIDEGTYNLSIAAEKPGWRIVEQKDFFIKNTPGFVYSNILGALANDRTRPLQIEVQNEKKSPVPDVNVTIFSKTGIYSSLTNESGTATIILNPGTESVDVTLEKLGYATTRYTLQTIGDTTAEDVWLSENWNLVSFTRLPDNPSADAILAPIRLDIFAVLGYEQGALSYYPTLPSSINTLKNLDAKSGYWVKANRLLVWPVEGEAIPASTPIALDEGWNLVSYLPEEALLVKEALASIHGKYELVRGFEGNALTYAPELPSSMSTLGIMRPGLGYWIKMMEPAILIYPEATESQNLGTTETDNFYGSNYLVNPNNSNSVVTRTWVDLFAEDVVWNSQKLKPGSIVTVLDPDGVVCGQSFVGEIGQIGLLPVYGDDPDTEEDEGAEPGDSLQLLINGFETSLSGELKWTGDGALIEIPLNPVDSFAFNTYLPSVQAR